ncbi:MAG: hypothetical protein HWN67_09975 [Candidatus Helarchaeota archaeon]|nr:hypothetical protein [Candidatus Helarchaeota archaeon]
MVVVTYNFTILNPIKGTFLTNFDLWIEFILIPYTVIGVTYLMTRNIFKTIKMLVVTLLIINLVYDWSFIGFSFILGIPLFWDINQPRVPYGFYAYEISYLTYFIISIILFILGIITNKYAKKYYNLAIPFTIFALGVVPMIVVFYQNDDMIWLILFMLQPNLLNFVLNRTITIENIENFYNYDLLIIISQIITAIIGSLITLIIYFIERRKNPNTSCTTT